MGDAADDIMDGLCCEGCGKWFRDKPPGHPRLCDRCKQQAAAAKQKKSDPV